MGVPRTAGCRAAAVAGVVLALVVAAPASAAWQKPVDVGAGALENASFLYDCGALACPPSDHVLGRFRMTGPRSGVGAITLPGLIVVSQESGKVVAGQVPTETNGLRYEVDSRLYGVTMRDGVWKLTDLNASAYEAPPWEQLSFDLGVDAAGNATLLYVDYGAGAKGENILMVRQNVGGAWRSPIQLDQPSVGQPGEDLHWAPRLAVSPNGNASVFFEDWVCPNGASYCSTVPEWTRQRRGGQWLPPQVVFQEGRPPASTATTVTDDGTATMLWSRYQPGVPVDTAPIQLMGRTLSAGVLGPAAIGPAGGGGEIHAVASPGGRNLLTVETPTQVSTRHALLASTLAGGVWTAPVTLSTQRGIGDSFIQLTGSADAADLLYLDDPWTASSEERGEQVPDLKHRRLLWRRYVSGAWQAPRPVDGGLPSPAPPSVVGPDDVAAGGGTIAFAAGALTPDGLRGADRIYAARIDSGTPTAPQPIDNGTGGWTHTVAVDRWNGANGAALFTQLAPDGNVRLYGVEDLAAGRVARAKPFGRELCTDLIGQIAGCVASSLDLVRASEATPRLAADGALVVSGTAVTVPRTVRATAAATRVLKRGTVKVAVEQAASRHRCRWWSTARRRFLAGSCRKPRFVKTSVRNGRFRLRLPGMRTGTITVWTAAASARRSQQVLRLGRSKRTVTLRRRG